MPEIKKNSLGLLILLVDVKEAVEREMTVRPIASIVNHETNELFFENLAIPVEISGRLGVVSG